MTPRISPQDLVISQPMRYRFPPLETLDALHAEFHKVFDRGEFRTPGSTPPQDTLERWWCRAVLRADSAIREHVARVAALPTYADIAEAMDVSEALVIRLVSDLVRSGKVRLETPHPARLDKEDE